ncbi:MAG TPA: hypothetical protein GX745_02840 [Clostridiales bacterium]|nr:hypothetical protein [Clostridiales bacterium]
MKNWLAKVGVFILGIVVGVIGTVGGIIGLGLWGYKSLSINKIEQLTKQDLAFLNAFLEQDSILKEMSIEQMIASVSTMPNKTFGELAQEYGIKYPQNISFLTEALNDVQLGQVATSLGSVIKNLKVANLLGAPYNDYETYPETYEGPAPLDAAPLLWTLRNYTFANMSAKLQEEVKLGSILGAPYDDFEDTSTAAPEGADSLMWAIRKQTINNLSDNLVNEIKIGNILGRPYSDFDNYPEDYEGALPDGVDTLLWAIRNYTIDNMSDNLLKEVKIGDILGEPYNDFISYPEDYQGELPEGAEALLWDLRAYTIKGETNGVGSYPDSLTVGDLRDVFGVSLPELFEVEDSVPLKQLGDEISNLYIFEIIDPPKPESDPITQNIINKMRSLKKDGTIQDPSEEPEGESDWYRLSELNDLMNALPPALTTQDVLTNPSDDAGMDKLSKVIMQKIYNGNFKVTELSQKIPQTLSATYIYEIIDEPGAEDDFVTINIINKLRTLTHDDGKGQQVEYTLSEINDLLKALPANLTIKDIIEEPQGSGIANNILFKIWETDASINELSEKLTQVFENLTFADILEEPVNPDSVTGRIIHKLRGETSLGSGEYWKVTQIEDAINTFTFGDLYPSADTGVLSLIDSDTPLDEVPAELERIIQETTMKDLYEKGLIQNQPHSMIKDYTIDQIIEYINTNLGG